MTKDEQWRPWPRDPTISVSNFGRVKSANGRILKPDPDRWAVKISGVNRKIKHLVWHAWFDDAAVLAITHRDGDRTNCAVSNLVAYDQARFIAVQRDALSKLDADDASRCVEMYRQGKSAREISEFFGVSGATVYNTIRRTGLSPKDIRRVRKVTAEQSAQALANECLRLWNEGVSWTEVARQLGVSRSCITSRLAAVGLSSRQMKAERKIGHDAAWAITLGIPHAQVDVKRRYLLKTYGLSLDEYQALKERQGHKCAACGKPLGAERTNENMMSVGSTYPAVDHCHRTDDLRHAVRGVLHSGCNAIVGMVREDREVLRRLGRYIETTRETRPMKPSPKTQALPGLH